jgi:uncharacterized protein (TIGR01777 family)
MRSLSLTKRSRLRISAERLFEWHMRPGAFNRLSPPWERVTPISQDAMGEGARAVFRVPMGPFAVTWVAEHRDFIPGRRFRDVQIAGPFARWEHTHTMTPDGPDCCWLEDHIEYTLPGGRLGRWLGWRSVARRLLRAFEYRHRVTARDLAAHHAAERMGVMRVVVSGASGLVGSELVSFLTTGGHSVARLVRGEPKGPDEVRWDPYKDPLDGSRLEDFDAAVHLSGENIAGGRWTAAKKERIRSSRIKTTTVLCEALSRLQNPPKVLVCASATGYYGDRGDEMLDESSPPGKGFVAELCRDWEACTAPAREKGIRVVNLRIGVVLSPKGGALAQMLTPFKLCVGGVVGSGKQYWSWIVMDDLIGAIHHGLVTEGLSGPVNGVAPNPATNREFTKTLGKVLGRPTVLPLPAFAARLALGEMADELLLASVRVMPKRLMETGYAFAYPELEGALRHVLGR